MMTTSARRVRMPRFGEQRLPIQDHPVTGRLWYRLGTSLLISALVAALPLSRTSAQQGAHGDLRRITERSFSAIKEDGWLVPASQWISIVRDSSAPHSPPSVARLTYPRGFRGGDAPALMERDLGGGATTIRVSMWIKLSPNWTGHKTGTNKVLHFWIAGLNRVFLFASGAGSDPLRPAVGLQGVASHGRYANLLPNVVPGAQLTRGTWHRWEVVLQANSNGASDGRIEWWLDGNRVGYYGNVAFVQAGSPRGWEVVKWDPTWGGLGDMLPSDQWMALDHLLIEGK